MRTVNKHTCTTDHDSVILKTEKLWSLETLMDFHHCQTCLSSFWRIWTEIILSTCPNKPCELQKNPSISPAFEDKDVNHIKHNTLNQCPAEIPDVSSLCFLYISCIACVSRPHSYISLFLYLLCVLVSVLVIRVIMTDRFQSCHGIRWPPFTNKNLDAFGEQLYYL